MNDFHTTAIPTSSNITPKTFSPSVMASPLLPRAASRQDNVIGNESGSLQHLIAQPYSERRTVVKKVEKEISKPKVIKPKTVTKPTVDKKSAYSLGIKTGSGFKRKGLEGLDRQMSDMAIKYSSSFAGISRKDRKMLGDIIEEKARALPSGSKFGHSTRKSMKETVQEKYHAGDITKADKTTFDKVIEKLK